MVKDLRDYCIFCGTHFCPDEDCPEICPNCKHLIEQKEEEAKEDIDFKEKMRKEDELVTTI